MRFWRRFWTWLRGIKRSASSNDTDGKLREFVYLDDVSVYSILASRKGAIDTQFTETQTASLNNNSGTSLSVGFPGTQAKVGSRIQSAQGQGSQVVRKAIVQTSFKQLYELESSSLSFRPPDIDRMPTVETVEDIEALLGANASSWVIDPADMHRGELLEVEVELQAELIFRIASVMTTIHDLIGESDILFENVLNYQELRQIGAVSQMLEAFLVGLIPIRGHLVDYVSATIGNRELLVHREILNQITPPHSVETFPVFLVGVTQHDLFWKDVRRVLFGDNQYTVFCRLATPRLSARWRPVKMADILGELMPHFDELVSQCIEQARLAMVAATEQPPVGNEQDRRVSDIVINEYSDLLVRHHESTRSPDLTGLIPLNDDWLSTISEQRRVFAEVTRYIDNNLEVTTSGDVKYRLRCEAKQKAGMFSTLPSVDLTSSQRPVSKDSTPSGRFLDAEIIAIYW